VCFLNDVGRIDAAADATVEAQGDHPSKPVARLREQVVARAEVTPRSSLDELKGCRVVAHQRLSRTRD
jgi:hypothetical protein